jgi:epoxyqueuosine reductase
MKYTKEAYILKEKLKEEAIRLGTNIIGFAEVNSWDKFKDTSESYYPQNIWPWSKTVIVLGLQIYLPMIETTPSVVYSELYVTTNRILDEMSYKVANYLNRLGQKAFFFPRDCYGDISVLVKNPQAAFSHVLAGKYAGLGTIGYNHTLITKEYGPRVRLVSVITDALLPPDNLIEKDLCVKCLRCKTSCPTSVFTTKDELIADMDRHKCAEYHEQLKSEYRYPCGVCIKVCPIGEDRKLYGETSVSPEGIVHCQNHGSKNSV